MLYREIIAVRSDIQGGSNMTGTNCGLFTHNQSRSYLNHLVHTNYTDTSCGQNVELLNVKPGGT
jgi:hypothetical protein